MLCMTTCSTYNEGATSLSKSRIKIARHEGYAVTGIDEESELAFEALISRQCDLCGGDPQCVRLCPTGALAFLPKKSAHLPKSDRLAKRIDYSETRAVTDYTPITRKEKNANS